MTVSAATLAPLPYQTDAAGASATADVRQQDRAMGRSVARARTHAAAHTAQPAIWRDIAVIVSVVTTGAAIGTALNVQSGMAPWISGAIALVAACIMMGIHALVRSTSSVADLDAEVQSLRKEVRRLAPAAARRPVAQYEPDYMAPVDTASNEPPAHASEGYGEPQTWAQAAPDTHAPVDSITAAYVPDPHQDTAPPDLEFERLQHLIRTLAEETAGPRANVEAVGTVAAVSLAASNAATMVAGADHVAHQRLPRTFNRGTLTAAALERETIERQRTDVTRPAAKDFVPTPATQLPDPTAVTSSRAGYGYGADHWRNDLSIATQNYGAQNYGEMSHAQARQESGLAGQMSEAIAAERVDVLLTPVQGLADKKAHHYEISVRLKLEDGVALEHGALSSAARTSGLGGRLDALRLSRVARVARHVERRSNPQRVLSTFIGTSLAEDAFLEAVADQFGANPSARIVMGFSQADVRGFGKAHWDTILTMCDMGLGFALEDVTDLDMDFATMKERGFQFVKLDASVFLEGLPAPSGPVPSADICRHFSTLGLSLIVGEIDDEWALAKIMGFGVVYGQGVMFGAPRPVKPEIVDAA
jgi:EAL domain-containing protein (putative c-di-GMP-specific phosphodiesterase class I)